MIFRNRLLGALSQSGGGDLGALLTEVHLQKGQNVATEGVVPTSVYFPSSAVLSAVRIMSDGRIVEVATYGFETASGLIAALSHSKSTVGVFAQIPGGAMMMSVQDLRQLAKDSWVAMQLLLRSIAIAADQAEQSVACVALHGVSAKMARWVLLTQDRTASNVFPLTQEYLAVMMGVQRTTVNGAAIKLKRAGLLTYSRGSVTVLDREGLERAACECYATVRDHWIRDPLNPTAVS